MKNSASSFSASSTSHQRWSDSSRESSPRGGNEYSNDRGYNNGSTKRRYNDSDNEYNKRNRYNDRYDDSDDYQQDKKRPYKGNKPTSYKDESSGGKRRRTDLVEDSRSNLDNFFTAEKKKKGKDNYNYSGKVNLNKKRQQQQQQNYDGDFPRGNGSDLPRPSSSGVIDLTKNDSGGYSKRAPKYHGGYNRR
jgi:hypothetical protein